MKQKLLLLLGAMFVALAIQAAAPASYLSFRVNGNDNYIGFDQFSNAVPEPYNLGTVYKMIGEDKPSLGITGYQVVMPDDREGQEDEQSHYMQVYIGVYDKSIAGTAYYDRVQEGLYLQPIESSTPTRFGHHFLGGTGSWDTNLGDLTASRFVWDDGMVDDFVLPSPLVYDEQTNSYKQGEYQKGHSYVIAVHFKEVVQCAVESSSWTSYWYYPESSGSEYPSFLWTNDHTKECLLASFDYDGDEASTPASIVMVVNGERKQYDLQGIGQQPIELGTIYRTEVTAAHNDRTWTLPDLGFAGFTFVSAAPYENSSAAGNYQGSMTFTTVEKSVADQYINEGLNVVWNDYKTGNFGIFPGILCWTENGPAELSENWTYDAYPLDVLTNWIFSGTHPVNVGWANDGDYGYKNDGKTYTVALYFSEHTGSCQPFRIHRNGGKYYKFNFTYSDMTKEEALAEPQPVDPGVTITPSSVAKPGSAQTTETGVTVVLDNADEVDKEEGSVTFKTPVTSEAMKSLMETTTPGSADFLASFKGVYLMVAAGKGQVDVLMETAGGIEMTAMCGTTVLDTYSQDGKGLVTINYDTPVNDWILLFPTTKPTAAGPRRAPMNSGMRVYSLTNTQDMLSTPLTFEAVTSGAITFNLNLSYGTDPSVMNPIEYQKNGGEWTTYTWGDAIAVVEGDKVAFRGDNVKYYGNGSPSYNSHIASTADVYVYGNMMSLIHASDFATNYTMTGDWNFANLFKLPTETPWETPLAVTTIKSHPTNDIVLPATTLTNYCYHGMFAGCKGITRAPELPATTMAVGCYVQMFRGTGLTEAPVLSATDMIPYSYDDEGEHGSVDCYMQMFQECTELTVAPALPATTLVHGVYQNMFEGCTSLVNAPALPATDLTGGDQCYTAMFKGCTSLVTAPALPATTLDNWCYIEMFSGCTSLVNAPELPATVLAEDCYHRMFEGCTSLQKAPVLPAPKLLGQVYGGMFDGCTSLNYVKCLAVDIVDTSHGDDATTECWLANVAATGTFVKADEADWSVKTYTTGDRLNGIPAGWTVKNASEETDEYMAAETPLTIEATEDATTVTITNPLTLAIQYSTDGGNTWITSSANPISISGIDTGKTVQLRGNNAAYSDGVIANSTIIYFNKDCYVYGNMMSLVSSMEFATATSLTSNNTFYDLFDSNDHLKNHPAKELVLPATTLTEGCYSNLFYKCTALTKAPVLPATTLAPMCFKSMFSGCTALTDVCELPAMTMTTECYARMFFNCKALTMAPELPATTMADYCYSFMFYGCNALTTAPALPATTMAPYCYSNMFGFCHALTATPALPATTLADNCYYRMFLGSNGLTTITSLPATTMAPYCYNEMFRQCQALTIGPTLPGTELADYCYRCMFQACTSLTKPSELPASTLARGCYLGMYVNTGLTEAPALPATTLAESCYYQMFQNNPNLVTSPVLPAAILPTTCYYKMFADCPALVNVGDLFSTTTGESSCEYMFMNCTGLVTAPALPATTLAPACYNFMFSGCSSLTKAPKLPAMTLASQCYQRMFEGCTSLVDAPALPAGNLAELCYNDMFWECTALKNAPALPATTLADYCYTMMFLGCSSLEKAPDLPAATLTSGCYEHMFMNCKSLNYVKCLATDLGDETSTDGWLTNVSETGLFLKADEADWSVKGTTPGTWGEGDAEVPTLFIHGIPAGWTVQTDTETNIVDLKGNEESQSFFYDLNGRHINGKPVQKGLYIQNGKKVAIK